MPGGKDTTTTRVEDGEASRQAAVKRMPRIPKKPKGYKDAIERAEENARILELAKKIERRNRKTQRNRVAPRLDLAPTRAYSSNVPKYIPSNPYLPNATSSNPYVLKAPTSNVVPQRYPEAPIIKIPDEVFNNNLPGNSSRAPVKYIQTSTYPAYYTEREADHGDEGKEETNGGEKRKNHASWDQSLA